MADGRHLEKSENGHISEPYQQLTLWTFKNPRRRMLPWTGTFPQKVPFPGVIWTPV